jgi:signal transduction histidine kinase
MIFLEPTKESIPRSNILKTLDSKLYTFDLKPGEHICFLYETEEEQRAVLIPLIIQGIRNKEKILYCVDTPSFQDIHYFLSEDEIEVNEYITPGQLAFFTKSGEVLKGKNFDCDAFIDLLRKETEQAKQRGYKSVRLIYEIEWVLLDQEIGAERILEFETKLNDFLLKNKCASICQYDRNKHDPGFLLDILSQHSLTILGTRIYGSIEEKKRAEETKIELEKRRRKFIEITSHELRTPLTSIKGFVDILKTYNESLLPDQRDQAFRLIHKNLSRLEVLIENVTDLSMIESGIFKVKKRVVSFCEFLNDEMMTYKSLLGHQFEYFPCLEDGLLVEIDGERIHQVFNNLVSNAIKYTSNHDRKIIMSVGAYPKVVRVTISDNGVGIEPENLERIFTPFSSMETKYSVVGTGIGMFLSREIIEKHQGTLTAQNKEHNKGAIFIIELPRKI